MLSKRVCVCESYNLWDYLYLLVHTETDDENQEDSSVVVVVTMVNNNG